MFDPRDDARDRDGREDGRARVYDDRDRDDDPREGVMRDLALPRGGERELVAVRDHVCELDGEDSRTLAAVGVFRVVPEDDLDIDHDTLDHAARQGCVLCVWEQECAAARDRTAEQDRRLKAVRLKLDRLDEAFLYSESIDLDTYGRQRDKLREELTLSKIDYHTEAVEELDVEGILAFAERILPRASDLWVQASLDYRQRLQELFFPEGIAFDGIRFNRTAVTALLFRYLEPVERAESNLASPPGFEPGFQP